MATNSTQQLLKSLEDRAKEIETLKRDLQKCEKERNVLESQKRTFDEKQPADIQNLLAQKRELHTQLEREESEKHELFSQINQLIGEIAELRANNAADNFRAQLNALSAENEELKQDFGRKEASFQALRVDLETLRAEHERRDRTHQLEKSRLAAEVQDSQRELELKSAAFQSLKLATQGAVDGGANSARLQAENEALRQDVQEKDDLLRELTDSNDELGRSLSEFSAQVDALRQKLDEKPPFDEQEVEKLRQKSSKDDAQLERLNVELKHLKSELETGKQEKSDISRQMEALKHELVEAQRMHQELKTKNASTREMDAEMREDLARLADALNSAKTELKNKESEFAKIQEQYRAQTLEMNRLMHGIEESERSALSSAKCRASDADELSIAKNELSKLKLRLAELEQTLDDESANESDAKAAKKDAEIVRLGAERDKMRVDLNATLERLAQVDEHVRELEKAFELAEERAENAQHNAKMLKESANLKAEELAKKSHEYETDISHLNTNLAAQRKEAELSLEKLRVVEAKFQQFESEKIKFFTTLNDALELPKTSKLPYEFDEGAKIFRAELNKLRASQAGEHEMASMEAELAELRANLIDSKKEAQNERELRDIKHNTQIENLKKELSTKVEQFTSLHDASSKNIASLEAERAHLKSEQTDAQAEIYELKQKLAHLDALIAEKQRLEAQVGDLGAKMLEKDVEIRRLSTSLTSTTDESNESEKIRELMDENARLAGDLLKQENATRQEFRAALVHERDAWLAEKNELEAQLVTSQKEIERLNLTNQASQSLDPVPKPRKSSTNLNSNGINGNATESSPSPNQEDNNTGSDAEIARLKADLEKQKRLVMVLRKKLQPEILHAQPQGSGIPSQPRRSDISS